MTQEECPFRSSRVLHDDQGEFHLCNREGGDCECIPSGCPYLIAKNSTLNLPDLPGYVQIDNEQGVCKESLQVSETCKEYQDSFTSLEEAAEKYAYGGIPDDMKPYVKPVADEVIKNFIAGAKWQKEQDKGWLLTKVHLDGVITGAEMAAKSSPMPEDTVTFQRGVAEGRRLEREDGGLAWQDIKSIVQIADKMLDDPKARVEYQNHNEEYYYKRVLEKYEADSEG